MRRRLFGSVATSLAKPALSSRNLYAPFASRSRDYAREIVHLTCRHRGAAGIRPQVLQTHLHPTIGQQQQQQQRNPPGRRGRLAREKATLHFRVTAPSLSLSPPRQDGANGTHFPPQQPRTRADRSSSRNGVTFKVKGERNADEIQARHVTASLPRRDWPSRFFSRARGARLTSRLAANGMNRAEVPRRRAFPEDGRRSMYPRDADATQHSRIRAELDRRPGNFHREGRDPRANVLQNCRTGKREHPSPNCGPHSRESLAFLLAESPD